MDIEPRSKKGRNTHQATNPQQPASKPKGKKKWIITGVIVAILALLVIVWLAFVRPPQMASKDAGALSADSNRAPGVYSVLVVGTDKVGLNTDTIFVVSLDTRTNKANVLSIPRDTMSDVERKVKKINAAYSIGGKANIEQLKKEIKNLIGFAPDNYVVVNLEAFVQVIDAIGGVNIDVPRDMDYEDPYQNLSIHLKKGPQVLSGQEAVGFVRYRKGYAEGDMGRVKAQQLFMQAVAKQLAQPSTLTKLPKLAEIVTTNMKTDLTMGEMVWFGKQGVGLNVAEDLQMFILPGEAQMLDLSYYIPNGPEILQMVNDHFNPYDKPITEIKVVDLNTIKAKASGSNKTDKVDPEIQKEKEQETRDLAGETTGKKTTNDKTTGDKTTNDKITTDQKTTDQADKQTTEDKAGVDGSSTVPKDEVTPTAKPEKTPSPVPETTPKVPSTTDKVAE